MTTTAETDGPLPRVLPRHRLRIALEYSDVSVQDMADTLGVGRNTVGNYLSGRTEPRMRDLRVWAMRTGVSLDWIQTGLNRIDGDDTDGGTRVATLGYQGVVKHLPVRNLLQAA